MSDQKIATLSGGQPRRLDVAVEVVVGTAVSGIFVPVQAPWRWVQVAAQVFPVDWIGLGMRSAFLPESAAAAELYGSWRPVATAPVLGVWALGGAHLERGEYNPSVSLALRIAGFYGVPGEAVSPHQPLPRVTDEEQNA